MRRLIFAIVLAGCGNVPNKNPNDMASARGDLAGGGGTGDMAVAPGCMAGAACQAGNGNGLCSNGACNACTDMTDDAMCATVYGAGNLCINGACAKGCRTASDCGGHQCVDNQCAAGCMSDSDCSDPATVCNTSSGACVSNASCGGAMNGAACPVNSADLCCGASGVCAAVACCGGDPCKVTPASASNDGTCMQGVCVSNSCAAPTGATRYVDFAAAAGGSGTMACPFDTIKAALTSLGSTGGTVLVKGGAASISNAISSHLVGAGIEITSSDASFNPCTPASCSDLTKWPTLTIGDFIAFRFATAGTRTLHYFNITGAGSANATSDGIVVGAATVTLDHLVVSGFQRGLTVSTGGLAKVGAGFITRMNKTGAGVLDGGSATGGSLDVELGAGDLAAQLSGNDVFGLYVEGNAKLKLNGPPYSGGTTAIFANSNGAAGVRFFSTVAATVTGLVAEGNGKDVTQTYRDGMVIFAKSNIKIRGSRFGANPLNGVHVVANGSDTTDGVSLIDLGSDAQSDPGANTFASNSGAGLCVDPGPANAGTNGSLRARGNTWNNSVGCTSAGGTITRGKSCIGSGADVAANCSHVLSVNACGTTNLAGGCTN
jgi:hypothetical protein